MSGEGAGGRGAAAAGSEREGSEGAEEAEDSAREKPEDDEAAEREELAAAKEAERHGPEGAKEAERPGTRSPTRSELKVPDSRASFSFLDAQDAYQSLPSTAPTGADRMGTRLWAGLELPEIETRTREMAVELLQPTVQRVTGLEAEFADLARDLKGISIAVDEHWRTRSLVELQNETLTAFRAEMARWDMLRMEQEGTVKTSLAAFRKEVDDLRYRCTRIDSAMETCSRGATRNNQALEELQRTTDSLRSHLTESVDGVKRMARESITTFESRMAHWEAKQLSGEDAECEVRARLTEALRVVRENRKWVESLAADVESMKEKKADAKQLHATQEDVRIVTKEANNNILALKQVLDRALVDLQEHFQTATQAMTAHNAHSQELDRKTFEAKLEEVAELQKGVVAFREEAERDIGSLKTQVSETRSWTEQLLEKTEGALKEVESHVKRDRRDLDVQAQSVKEKLDSVRSAQEQGAETIDRLGRVLWTLTQSERVSSALDLQDTADRSSLALVGFKEGAGAGAGGAGPGAARSSRGASRPGPPAAGASEDHGGPGAITVDQRCLSCSGQASTVLSGFKMACLQYRPGPVNFSRRWHSRGELQEMREKLLEEAQESLATWGVAGAGGASGEAPRGGAWPAALADAARRPAAAAPARGRSQPAGAPGAASVGAPGGCAAGRPGEQRPRSGRSARGPGGLRMPALPLSARAPPASAAAA